MSKFRVGLEQWNDLVLESEKLEPKESNSSTGIDLYSIELTSGEKVLCSGYCVYSERDECLLEVIAPCQYDYYVSKKDIKKITQYKEKINKSFNNYIYFLIYYKSK